MEWLQPVLEWLVPAGGLGSLAVWLTSRTLRTLRQLRTSKEIHDTYKLMYEDVSKEVRGLRQAVGRLERAISRASTCRYYGSCPVASGLREQQDGAEPAGRKGGSAHGQREHGAGTADEGDTGAGRAGGTGSDA
ncbi:MAG: hypothetical protein LBJ01_00490 [Tannerella sp.]|jgi:hypothetical protein|nr:hypothetical protein [Tannerella sp.]